MSTLKWTFIRAAQILRATEDMSGWITLGNCDGLWSWNIIRHGKLTFGRETNVKCQINAGGTLFCSLVTQCVLSLLSTLQLHQESISSGNTLLSRFFHYTIKMWRINAQITHFFPILRPSFHCISTNTVSFRLVYVFGQSITNLIESSGTMWSLALVYVISFHKTV